MNIAYSFCFCLPFVLFFVFFFFFKPGFLVMQPVSLSVSTYAGTFYSLFNPRIKYLNKALCGMVAMPSEQSLQVISYCWGVLNFLFLNKMSYNVQSVYEIIVVVFLMSCDLQLVVFFDILL